MKTIIKYSLIAGAFVRRPFFKITITCISALLATQNAFGQRDLSDRQPLVAINVNLGLDNFLISNNALNQWTKSNFNLVEQYNPNLFFDFNCIYKQYDIGFSVSSNGNGFDVTSGYIGIHLTHSQSAVSSWLNLEFGGISGRFTNITPVNYIRTPDQVGQKMELHYLSDYWGLSFKNYLNFLHYNAPFFKHKKVPVNTGVFVSAGYQPYRRQWNYGYYNKDTVFTAVRIKTIPTLGKVHATAGVFMGF